jgi:hypothetical protein
MEPGKRSIILSRQAKIKVQDLFCMIITKCPDKAHASTRERTFVKDQAAMALPQVNPACRSPTGSQPAATGYRQARFRNCPWVVNSRGANPATTASPARVPQAKKKAPHHF